MNVRDTHVFIVDDEPAIRSAVQRTMQSAGMHASTFSCAEDCLAALSRQPCDLVIADIRLGGVDGLSLLKEIRSRFPWLQVILITGYGDVPTTRAALKAGAVDLLEKPLDRDELLSAVATALKATVRPVPFAREALSPSEIQVLRLFLAGRTSKETAEALNRSTRTIEAHRHRLMRKFGVHNAVQLAQKASALWRNDPDTPDA